MPRKSMLSVLPCALLVVTLAMLAVPAQDAELITKVQSALKDKGLDPGPIDGLMGPRTSRALRDFQIQNDIQVTGEINKETLDRLGIKGSFLGRVGSSFKAAGGAVAGAATTGAKATASGATTGAKATAKGGNHRRKGRCLWGDNGSQSHGQGSNRRRQGSCFGSHQGSQSCHQLAAWKEGWRPGRPGRGQTEEGSESHL